MTALKESDAERGGTQPRGRERMSLGSQIVTLFLLAIPVACVAWTVTNEELLREPREFCERKSRDCRRWLRLDIKSERIETEIKEKVAGEESDE